MRPLPVEVPPIEMQLVWHPGRAHEAAHLWLRGLVHDAVVAAGLRV